jgi:hypothetical protein
MARMIRRGLVFHTDLFQNSAIPVILADISDKTSTASINILEWGAVSCRIFPGGSFLR